MSSIAIDIILTLPEHIQEEIINLNKWLTGSKDAFLQNSINCIPHITILMGCVEESNIPELEIRLWQLSWKLKWLHIESLWIEKFTLPDGNLWPYVAIAESKELQYLYDSVIDILRPLMHYNVQREHFAVPEDINNITLEWTIRNTKKAKWAPFHPHISIGIGDMATTEYSRSFGAKWIGIYQIGNYCTCRKELFSLNF